MRRRARAVWVALAITGCGGHVPPAAEPTRASTVTARAPTGPEWTRASDALSRRMRELAARAGAHGALPDERLELRAFLAARGTRSVPIEIPAGACWTIATVSSGGMRDLDARLFTGDGDLVAEDVAPDPHPTLQACAGAEEPRQLWLVLDAYDGSGGVLVAALRTPRASLAAMRAEIGGAPGRSLDPALRPALDVALERRGFELFEAPTALTLAAGQSVRVPLRTRAGRCYAVVVRTQAPLARVALRLLDVAGQPIALGGDRAPEPALQICADDDVERAIEVTAIEGEGEATILVAQGDDEAVGGDAGLWLGTRPEAD